MNTLKRAWLSIIRRKGKSLIFLVVVFILGNLMAASFSIQQATKNVEKTIKYQLGANAFVELDWERLDKEAYVDENGNYITPDYPLLTQDLLDQIGALPEVKYFDYVTYIGLETKDYKRVEAEENGYENVDNYTYFNLQGISYPELADIDNGKIELTQGRVFTQENINEGSNGIIISENLADLNGLNVGDTLILKNNVYNWNIMAKDSSGVETNEPFASRDVPLEIIGIFKPLVKEVSDSADQNEIMDQKWRINELDNTIYATNKFVQEETDYHREQSYYANEEQYKEEGITIEDLKDSSIYSPSYTLNSPEEIDAFVSQASLMIPEYYSIRTSASEYEQIAGPLVSLGNMAQITLYGAMFVSVLVLSLVTVLFLRDRKHELGIYLSLGDKKTNVFKQIILEVVIISFIGLTLSLFTGNLIASSLSSNLLTQEDNYYYGYSVNEVSQNDVLDEYKVELTPEYILVFYAIGLGVSIASTIIPVIYITRLKPKEIMM